MKLKDYFTLGNLLSGFAAVIALLHSRFDWACYLIYIAYAFDALDGPVARLTKQFDTFGAHLDTASDYVVNSICSSYIIYYAFERFAHYPWWAAAFVAAWPVAFGTIRQARGADDCRPSYPCYWIGVPRPVATLAIIALLQSGLFPHDSAGAWGTWGHAVSAATVIVLSVLHLSRIPFINNKHRRWMGIVRVGVYVFLAGAPIAALLGWAVLGRLAFFFDYVLFCLIIYIILSWATIPRTDLRRIRAYLAGGELVRPLVHKDLTWRGRTLFPFFDPPLTPEEDAQHR